jgi:hypothetical protein
MMMNDSQDWSDDARQQKQWSRPTCGVEEPESKNCEINTIAKKRQKTHMSPELAVRKLHPVD